MKREKIDGGPAGALSLPRIRENFARFVPRPLPEAGELPRAAVAMVLRAEEDARDAEILMIRRAEHPLDPWSGHMGFPGGRVDPGDLSPQHTAVREAREEIGLDLDAHARPLGPLSEIRARSHTRLMPLTISPFLYEAGDAPPFVLNQEVREVVWIPLEFFLRDGQRAEMPHPGGEALATLPCYHFGPRVIWGLSLMMLDELLFEILPSR